MHPLVFESAAKPQSSVSAHWYDLRYQNLLAGLRRTAISNGRPRVSIIIPSYNHARFLPACLDSVFAQTFVDWEAILLDDGSTDASIEVARGYSLQDDRLKVIVNEQNLGTYGTQQRGVELSRGEFIAILNSDDMWQPEKLATQVQTLSECPQTAYSCTLGWMCDVEGRVDKREDVHGDWPVAPISELLPFLLSENRILASSVLFRRENLAFDTSCRYSGDWVTLLRRSRLGPAALVQQRLVYWRQHDNNTYSRSPKQVLEEVRVRLSVHQVGSGWHNERVPLRDVRLGLAKNALNIQALAVLCGCPRLSLWAGLQALKLHPSRATILKRFVASLMPIRIARARLWKGETVQLPCNQLNGQAPIEF